MDPARVVVAGAVALVVGTVLVSGPLVGAVDLTHERTPQTEAPVPGGGSATVEVVSVPDTVFLRKGRYGSGAYTLEVPPAAVRISNLTGRPMLVYKLRLPALGYTRSTVHFLGDGDGGRLDLTIESDALAPGEIESARAPIEGELLVVIRSGTDERTLYRGNVTVRVQD